MSFNAFNVKPFDTKLATDGDVAGILSWLEDLVAENMKFHQERAVYHNKAYEYWLDVSRALKSVPLDQLPNLQKVIAMSSRHEPEIEMRQQSFQQNASQPTFNTRTSSNNLHSRTYASPQSQPQPMVPTQHTPAAPTQHTPSPPTNSQDDTSNMRLCIAAYTYKDGRPEANSLNFPKHQIFQILDSSSGWWLVKNLDTAEQGYVPMNYMRVKFTEPDEKRIAAYLAQLKGNKASPATSPAPSQALPSTSVSTPAASTTIANNSAPPSGAARKVNIVTSASTNATPSPAPRPTSYQTPSTASGNSFAYNKPVTTAPGNTTPSRVSPAPHSAAPSVIRVRARFDYKGSDSTFLTFKAGEILTVQGETAGEDWWLAVNENGQTGYAPSNFLQAL